MLSRRNVRIKIMQVLYAAQRQGQPPRYAARLYADLVQRSFQLYLQNLLILQRICEYAKVDEATRRNKLRPTEEDKTFRAILASNPSVRSLSDNDALSRKYNQYKINGTIDADQIKRLYREFVSTEEHAAYVALAEPTAEDTTAILLRLYKWIQRHELFLTMIEDHFPLWEENRSLIIGAIKKTIKALPVAEDFFIEYEEPSEAVEEFGERLLEYVVGADEQLLTKIKTVLENWDADRVALIDMILIKMALGEFLDFPDIPPVVTLNEYVDISKLYSTPKSKEFINGVLDKLLKNLQTEGLIQK